MLIIHPLVMGAYQTNCYIIHEQHSSSCCVIDPGYNPETILDTLDALGLTLEAIVLTHGHFDHVGAVRDLFPLEGLAEYTVEAGHVMCPFSDRSGQPQTKRWYLLSLPLRMFPPQKESSGFSIPLSTYRRRTESVPHTFSPDFPSGIGRNRSLNRPPSIRFFHSAGNVRSVI